MRVRIALGLLGLAAVGCGGLRGPSGTAAGFRAPRGAHEAEVRARFLEQRLDAGRLHARAWQWGWTAVNGGSALESTIAASRTNDAGERAFDVVQAAIAALGLVDVQLLHPMPGRSGADPMRGGDPATGLERGEQVLAERAERAKGRRQWPLHLENVALQAVGGGILLALGQPRYALISFGSGVAGGEAFIWSEPWRPRRDLADYERLAESGGLPSEPATTLELVPAPGGVALRLAH